VQKYFICCTAKCVSRVSTAGKRVRPAFAAEARLTTWQSSLANRHTLCKIMLQTFKFALITFCTALKFQIIYDPCAYINYLCLLANLCDAHFLNLSKTIKTTSECFFYIRLLFSNYCQIITEGNSFRRFSDIFGWAENVKSIRKSKEYSTQIMIF
jgi:hypothetical protein